MMAITDTLLSFLWSFLLASGFWVVMASAFGFRRNPIISVFVVGLIVFGLSLVFDITGGLSHILGTAYIAALNQSFNVFTLGAMLAAVGVLAAIVSALAVVIDDAVSP